MLEPHDVDALAARTKARELAWARNEGGDAVAVDADGVRYILSADGAALFVVLSCARTWAASAGVRSRGCGPSSLARSVTSPPPTSPRTRPRR